jgi:steroid 5-alpha reductase family enzyme
MDVQAYLLALALILGVGVAAWAVSVAIRNVAFVDSLWSPDYWSRSWWRSGRCA